MTRISCSIPFDAPGLSIGHLCVPHSDDVHAYGVIPVPIAVLNGAPGPTMLLAAGVHGDEYEGQVVLRRLLRTDPTTLSGRLIVLPALNLPAVRAARRVPALGRRGDTLFTTAVADSFATGPGADPAG